ITRICPARHHRRFVVHTLPTTGESAVHHSCGSILPCVSTVQNGLDELLLEQPAPIDFDAGVVIFGNLGYGARSAGHLHHDLAERANNATIGVAVNDRSARDMAQLARLFAHARAEGDADLVWSCAASPC